MPTPRGSSSHQSVSQSVSSRSPRAHHTVSHQNSKSTLDLADFIPDERAPSRARPRERRCTVCHVLIAEHTNCFRTHIRLVPVHDCIELLDTHSLASERRLDASDAHTVGAHSLGDADGRGDACALPGDGAGHHVAHRSMGDLVARNTATSHE